MAGAGGGRNGGRQGQVQVMAGAGEGRGPRTGSVRRDRRRKAIFRFREVGGE
jgi:hypothetical protein